jgi:phage terminase large subunit-like protein
MESFVIPKYDSKYPSLGSQVIAWIEDNLVYGPGDLRGMRIKLDDEKKALLKRIYEIYPKGHPQAGRRRFKRVALSLRKGSAKTEFAALIAAAELHPDAPVRFSAFDKRGELLPGVGVTDPYIPMVAYTEEQSDELAYGALRVILSYSRLADDFDIGLTRIMRKGGDGKAISLATAPNSRDGARTTFQVFDETHRLTLPRQRMAHLTMLANIPKREMSDAWSLEITTAPAPGENSVAEDTMDYARQVVGGKIKDSRLFFFHRQASDEHKLDTPEDIRAAVIEASGPVAAWSDIDGICEQFRDPTLDTAYLRRVWLNQIVRASERAFDITRWDTLADPDYMPADGSTITLGFDGARWHDSTALVGTEIATGFQMLLGLWERPENVDEWEVPADVVDDVVAEAIERWEVWRMYCDPPYWETTVAEWSGKYGEKRIVEWWTNRQKQIAYAVKGFNNAIQSGDLLHDGNPHLRRHIGNAVRGIIRTVKDEKGQPLWTIYKERTDSPHKIDAAMAAILSWEARGDALAAGVGVKQTSVYETRGIVAA